MGEESEECRCVMASRCCNFQPEDNKGGRSFLVPPRVPWRCASVLPSPHTWLTGSCGWGKTACVHLGTGLQRYCIWKGGDNWIVEAGAYDRVGAVEKGF